MFILHYPSISNIFISIVIIYIGGALCSRLRVSSGLSISNPNQNPKRVQIECPVCLGKFYPID